jgi:hypothetical protein
MDKLQDILQKLIEMMQSIVYLLISAAVLGFIWGILKYLTSGSSSEQRKNSVAYMTYGVIALLVITSVWGFVYMLGSLLGIKLNNDEYFPPDPFDEGPLELEEINLENPPSLDDVDTGLLLPTEDSFNFEGGNEGNDALSDILNPGGSIWDDPN